MKAPFSEWFWEQVRKGDGCWLWLKWTDELGYGKYRRERKAISAHRTAYQLARGAIPGGMVVMHSCDTPACVRPDHLRLGTHAENRADCVAKRRHAWGELNGRAKLTWHAAEDIRRKGRAYGVKRMAVEYEVDPKVIRDVLSGKTWREPITDAQAQRWLEREMRRLEANPGGRFVDYVAKHERLAAYQRSQGVRR